MKRFSASFFAVVLIMSFCFASSAAQQKISIKYVPRTERGTLFYLDIYSDPVISAAVFELWFDPSAVEYRDAECDDENGYAMGNADGDTVKIAYSHRAGKSGQLCRLSFKALKVGTVRFSLHMSQAVDGDLDYLTNLSDTSLEVKLGKEDVILSDDAASNSEKSASDKSSSKTKDPTEKAEKKSYGGEKSEIAEYKDGSESTEATERAPIDFTGGNNQVWFLLGGGVVLSAVLLIGAGYLIGKKHMNRPEKKDAQDEEIADDPMDEINSIIDEERE